MYQTPEQLIAMNKANLEAAMKFAGVAIEGAEKVIDLQLKAAKAAFADSFEGAKALASVKDFQQLAAAHHADAFAEMGDDREIVADHQHGQAVLMFQALQQVDDLGLD